MKSNRGISCQCATISRVQTLFSIVKLQYVLQYENLKAKMCRTDGAVSHFYKRRNLFKLAEFKYV